MANLSIQKNVNNLNNPYKSFSKILIILTWNLEQNLSFQNQSSCRTLQFTSLAYNFKNILIKDVKKLYSIIFIANKSSANIVHPANH